MNTCGLCGHPTNRAAVCGTCVVKERAASKIQKRAPRNLRFIVDRRRQRRRELAKKRKEFTNTSPDYNKSTAS